VGHSDIERSSAKAVHSAESVVGAIGASIGHDYSAIAPVQPDRLRSGVEYALSEGD